jgi:hypothetical protein
MEIFMENKLKFSHLSLALTASLLSSGAFAQRLGVTFLMTKAGTPEEEALSSAIFSKNGHVIVSAPDGEKKPKILRVVNLGALNDLHIVIPNGFDADVLRDALSRGFVDEILADTSSKTYTHGGLSMGQIDASAVSVKLSEYFPSTQNRMPLLKAFRVLSPAVSKLNIVNGPVMNTTSLQLSWEKVDGSYTEYCILENDSDVKNCTFITGTLPATYESTSSVEGNKVLYVWLKNHVGNVGPRFESPMFTLDTTTPELSSFEIVAPRVTNNRNVSLKFGEVRGSFESYSIKENDTKLEDEKFVKGPLPQTYELRSTEGTKILSIWLKDSAGNISRHADSNPVMLNTRQ